MGAESNSIKVVSPVALSVHGSQLFDPSRLAESALLGLSD